MGKTSAAKVFINGSGYPAIYIDARRLSEYGFLRGRRKLDFRRVIAYSYDNLRSARIILTGS